MAEPNKLQSIPGKAKEQQFQKELKNQAYGRVLPQALELEEAVLGAIMTDKDGLPSVNSILRPESFYSEANKIIYEHMEDLFKNSQPVDLLTVHESLRKAKVIDKIGGINYLMDLSNRVASSANVEFHARIVAQKFVQRELIKVSTETIKDAFEDTKDIFDMLDEAERNLYEITDKNISKSFESLRSLVVKTRDEIETVSNNQQEGLTGIPTGFTDLNKMTGGWQPSDLIILAARPGMGKTAFALSLARNAAIAQKGVAIFSLEMGNTQLCQRLLAMECELPNEHIRKGTLDEKMWEQLNTGVERLAELPIYIDDTPGINIYELRAKCRRLKNNHNIGLIVIDYLQLMTVGAGSNSKGNREQEISTISRALKGLAKELNVPVIALSQLSRNVESRGGPKRPMLSDLRESGAIEQDADMVTFVYRPAYYKFEDPDVPPGASEIIIAKHRNGSTGEVFLKFIGEMTKFVDYEQTNFGDINMGSPMGGGMEDNYGIAQSRMNLDDENPF
jgi:replicative DNA helicase